MEVPMGDYECRQCQINFKIKGSDDDESVFQCPSCQSADVGKRSFSAKILDFIRGIFVPGG